jgi:hypothetical protein
MKPTRCAAWLAPGGNASYFPALLFARVGAEDPRYPRPLPVATATRGAGGIFSISPRAICVAGATPVNFPSYFSTKSRANALMAPITSRSARWRGLS